MLIILMLVRVLDLNPWILLHQRRIMRAHIIGGREKKIIQDYKNYHSAMVEFFQMIGRYGPDYCYEPEKPKASYKSLLGESKKSTKLAGKDLHKFLMNSCVNSDNPRCRKVSDVGVFTSLVSIKDYLISGYNGLKKKFLNNRCID